MKRKRNTRRVQALYSTIIFIIPSAFIGGYFVGMVLDRQFGTEPWMTIGGVFLGAAGAFYELFRVVKRGERFSKQDNPKEKNKSLDQE